MKEKVTCRIMSNGVLVKSYEEERKIYTDFNHNPYVRVMGRKYFLTPDRTYERAIRQR